MVSTQTPFKLLLLLFLFLAPCRSLLAQEEGLSDSLEVISADSAELGEDGFQEILKEKFIEGEPSWLGFGSLFVLFHVTVILFWIALILFLAYRLFRYFLRGFSEKNKGG